MIEQRKRRLFRKHDWEFALVVYGENWAVNWYMHNLFPRFLQSEMNGAKKSEFTVEVYRNYMKTNDYSYAIPLVLMEGENYEGP